MNYTIQSSHFKEQHETFIYSKVTGLLQQGQIQENRKGEGGGGSDACEGGPDACEVWPIGHTPPPPPPGENFCIFYSLRLLNSAFSGKNSAQNLIN